MQKRYTPELARAGLYVFSHYDPKRFSPSRRTDRSATGQRPAPPRWRGGLSAPTRRRDGNGEPPAGLGRGWRRADPGSSRTLTRRPHGRGKEGKGADVAVLGAPQDDV